MGERSIYDAVWMRIIGNIIRYVIENVLVIWAANLKMHLQFENTFVGNTYIGATCHSDKNDMREERRPWFEATMCVMVGVVSTGISEVC